MAGLVAANALTNAGVPCVVLEARHRLGGRTHTVDFGGLAVDFGGSWVHHPHGNPMARLADQLGLRRVSGDFRRDMVMFDPDTGRVDAETAEQVRRLDEEFDDRADELGSALGLGTDVGTAIEHFLEGATPPGMLRDLARRRIVNSMEADASGPVGGVGLAQLSGIPDAGYRGDDIGDFIVGGYREVVEALAGGLDIRLATPVTGVGHGPLGVTVTTTSGVEEGSHALVTFPLGVLKKGTVGFEPGLPPEKLAAIERVGFGTFEKVVIRFPRSFWADHGVPHLLPLPTSSEPGIRAVFGMDAAFGEPVVVAFGFGGSEAVISESDEAAARAVIDLLEAATGAPAPAPVEIARTSWAVDPWSLGAYSYLTPGATVEDHAALGAPVGGRLLFAGEATSTTRAGYVDGAMTSGIREAKRLLGSETVALGRISPR